MSFRIVSLATAIVLTSAMAGGAQAQTSRLHFGPRASYQFDIEEFGIGAQLSVPIATHLEFYPSFDYFFVNSGSYWDINADLKYRIATESVDWLYVGAGLNIRHTRRQRSDENRATDDNQAGLNLIAGVESLRGRVHPFAELRFTANKRSTTQLSAGLNFTLRGN
jgi:hypothetical protein